MNSDGEVEEVKEIVEDSESPTEYDEKTGKKKPKIRKYINNKGEVFKFEEPPEVEEETTKKGKKKPKSKSQETIEKEEEQSEDIDEQVSSKKKPVKTQKKNIKTKERGRGVEEEESSDRIQEGTHGKKRPGKGRSELTYDIDSENEPSQERTDKKYTKKIDKIVKRPVSQKRGK